MDYFSRYIETQKLSSTTSSSIIIALKSIFACHGIPDVVVTDNGPQYSSSEFETFAASYNFSHITSSPYYLRGNGEVERAVRTLKNLLKEAKDPYLALIAYRVTTLPWCNLSPSQLLMGRRLRTVVPETDEVLSPSWPNLTEFREVDKQYKKKLKQQYDRRHRARELPEFSDDTKVFITNGRSPNAVPGRVIQSSRTRSYIVETPTGASRRNRCHLHRRPADTSDITGPNELRSPIQARSRTGTVLRPPNRLTY